MKILYLSHQPEGPGDAGREPALHQVVSSYASPGTTIDVAYPDDFEGAKIIGLMGDQQVLTGLNHAMPTPSIITKIVWAEQQGYDAVVQANHFDPGVEPGRLATRIPVIGPFRAGLHVGATLADRIGILVPLAGHVAYVRRLLRSYGMQDFVSDIRPIGVYGRNMIALRDEILTRAVTALKTMVREGGVELIVPMGGAIIPQVISPEELEREVGVPVINNTAIAIRVAEMCVALGMTHSLATYPMADLRYEDFRSRANPPGGSAR